MPERSANISTHDPFGSLLGYAPGGIAIYSSDYHTADEKEYPDDAAFRSYLGREYMGCLLYTSKGDSDQKIGNL